MNPVVVLLARAPSAKGKTRLTAHLPSDRAHALRAALFLDTLDVVRATALPVIVSFTPADAHDEMATLAPDARLMPQAGIGLGERMRHAIDEALAAGFDAVVLIGSDLPTLPARYVRDAIGQLEGANGARVRADLVLGPSEDGGFYLVGVRHPLPDIFHDVLWDGPAVLKSVVDAARALEMRVAFAREWWDVDQPEDLERLVKQSNASAPGAACDVGTARRLREFLDTSS